MPAPSQKFTQRELNWMRRWRSQAHLRVEHGTRPTTRSEWRNFLSDIQERIHAGSYEFSSLRWHHIGGRTALSAQNLEDVLVIRKISSNVRRCYGIREANRSDLVRTAKRALSESVPKTILRIDLKGCYESIDRNKLIKKLKAESLVSSETLGLIKQLFHQAESKLKRSRTHGIPRGLILSTSLAELALGDLDKKLRAIPGVYLVLRYVDDILLFTTEDASLAENSVREIITELGLKINEGKFQKFRVSCLCEKTCPHQGGCPCANSCRCSENHPQERRELEFLGYKLIFSPHNVRRKDKFNDVNCTLSSRKMARIKSRIWAAFEAANGDGDWSLLEDRIRYISDNQKLESEPGRRGLLAGISYTHAECVQDDPSLRNSLQTLDQFYQTKLRRIRGLLPPDRYNRLRRISFTSGFVHHRRTHFSGRRVLHIKSCWE